VDPAKDARGQLAPLSTLRTRAAQLFEIAIKLFDYFARVINKLALLFVHAESSLAQNRR
jgi:hypothetical protein